MAAYKPTVTAQKGAATAANVGGFGGLFCAVFFVVRANWPEFKLWPVEMDAAVVVALTSAASSLVRMINNWRKPRD
jgi:hypothetical protein